MDDLQFKRKYLKYKSKYLEFKYKQQSQHGGSLVSGDTYTHSDEYKFNLDINILNKLDLDNIVHIYTGTATSIDIGSLKNYKPLQIITIDPALKKISTKFGIMTKPILENTNNTLKKVLSEPSDAELKLSTIPNNVFSNFVALTTIDLPYVETIGNSAFQNCSALTTIDLPEVTTIGMYAFHNCSALTTIVLPKVTTIVYGAFDKCTALTTIDLPNVKKIGRYAFINCSALATIALPNVTTIDYSAFHQCSALTTIDLPKVTTIGMYAFQNCSALTTIALPNVKTIKDDAFKDCKALTRITISYSLMEFPRPLFPGSKLETVSFHYTRDKETDTLNSLKEFLILEEFHSVTTIRLINKSSEDSVCVLQYKEPPTEESLAINGNQIYDEPNNGLPNNGRSDNGLSDNGLSENLQLNEYIKISFQYENINEKTLGKVNEQIPQEVMRIITNEFGDECSYIKKKLNDRNDNFTKAIILLFENKQPNKH